MLKVLRPLRVISRNQGLKISIRALGVALGGIVNILIMTSVFVFVFGIITVNYYKGRFYDCIATYSQLSALKTSDGPYDIDNYSKAANDSKF